jgi:hypothetical protein
LQDCIRDVSEENSKDRTFTDDFEALLEEFKQVGLITDG